MSRRDDACLKTYVKSLKLFEQVLLINTASSQMVFSLFVNRCGLLEAANHKVAVLQFYQNNRCFHHRRCVYRQCMQFFFCTNNYFCSGFLSFSSIHYHRCEYPLKINIEVAVTALRTLDVIH